MAKGGGSRGGGFTSIRSSSSSYRTAPTPRPIIHNNIFTREKTSPIPPPVSKPSTLLPPSQPLLSTSPHVSPSSTLTGGGFLSTMIDGFGFGVGTSIGRKMVDNIFSSTSTPKTTSTIPISTQKENTNCNELNKSLQECLQMNGSDMNICKKAFDDYEACKNNKI